GADGDVEYWAAGRLQMALEQRAFYALDAWQVEGYHRGPERFAGIERAQFRLAMARRNHVGLAIRASYGWRR
ncbi:MAG: IS701 family transposase, partial [Candidatus Thermofonsia Clade 3 bacterium]